MEEKQRENIADLWRQLGFFAPTELKKKIHIVGIGATGSHIADTLACMGIKDIVAYDFDVVENHNLPNQIYNLNDIGKPKVVALQQHIKQKMGWDIEIRNEKVEKIEGLSGYLFLCTDSMDAQKSIALSSARLNRNVDFVIETRMSIDHGRVYFFDPNNKIHLKKWLEEWYPNEAAAPSPCNLIAISATAKLIAATAAARVALVNRVIRPDGPDYPIFNRTLISMDGTSINSKWE